MANFKLLDRQTDKHKDFLILLIQEAFGQESKKYSFLIGGKVNKKYMH